MKKGKGTGGRGAGLGRGERRGCGAGTLWVSLGSSLKNANPYKSHLPPVLPVDFANEGTKR